MEGNGKAVRPEDRTTNIMIVGVGGQGTLLASKILGHLLVAEGYDVKVSEVHGMSQRGGSVVTYVRFGRRVYAPIIDEGGADYILSFEKLEGARWLRYLKPDGLLITNLHETDPMPVITGAMAYPADLIEKMEARGVRVDAVEALALAEEAGSAKAVNLVLMGRLSRHFPDIAEAAWREAITACVPARYLEMNLKAFALGRA